MARLLVPIFTIALLAAPFAHSQDTVTTSVDLDYKFSQLWRAKHPSKFMKCWGKGNEVKMWEEEEKLASSSNDGHLGKGYQNKEKAFTEYTPVLADWSARLTPDRTFELEFSQDVTKDMFTQQKSTCTTNNFFSRLNAVNNEFISHASMLIPAGVRLIRVRKTRQEVTQTTTHELKASISHAMQVIEDGPATEIVKNEVKVGDYDYFFVQPGDRIDFAVQWQSQAIEDAGFKVSFEIRMIGNELCRENLWDPDQVKGDAILPFIREKFSARRMIDYPHETVAGLACLGSPEYMNDFLKESHGKDLIRFLEGLGDAYYEFQSLPDDGQLTKRVISTVLHMTSLELSRNLLNDLNVYCAPQTVLKLFTDQPAKPVRISGYHFAAREYYKIRLILESAPRELLQTFADTLAQLGAEGRTYAEVYSGKKFATLEEMQYLVFEKSLRTFTLIRSRLDVLPQVTSGAAHQEAVRASLDRGDVTLDALENEFKNVLLRFARSENETISVTEFSRLVRVYNAQIAETASLLETDLDWFATDPASGALAESPFVHDMMALNSDIYMVAADFLQRAHAKKLGAFSSSDFIRYDEMKKLTDNVTQCLMEAPL